MFEILDLDLEQSPPRFRNYGSVKLEYRSEEKRWSRNLLKYKIDGPGLDNRGGTIWFDKEGGYLVAFEIAKPDEPGYESGKMTLQQIISLDGNGWEEFKMDALNK